MAAEEDGVDDRWVQRVFAMEMFPRYCWKDSSAFSPYDALMMDPSAKPSSVSRSSSTSLGTLDTLPTEAIISILEALDFRSLSRFSRVGPSQQCRPRPLSLQDRDATCSGTSDGACGNHTAPPSLGRLAER
jgi:hypothetical protein